MLTFLILSNRQGTSTITWRNYGRSSAVDDPRSNRAWDLRGSGSRHPRQGPQQAHRSADRDRPRPDGVLCVRGHFLHAHSPDQDRTRPAAPTTGQHPMRRLRPKIVQHEQKGDTLWMVVGILILLALSGWIIWFTTTF